MGAGQGGMQVGSVLICRVAPDVLKTSALRSF